MKKPAADELLLIIRKHCLKCSGGSRREVKNCLVHDCLLYPYRITDDGKAGKKQMESGRQLSIFDLYKANASQKEKHAAG